MVQKHLSAALVCTAIVVSFLSCYRNGNNPAVAPLKTPVQLSPTDSATNQEQVVCLQWASVNGASSYRVQLSSTSSFSTCFIDDSSIAGDSFHVTGLAVGSMYYWRICALSNGDTSAWSGAWSFSTFVLGPPDFLDIVDAENYSCLNSILLGPNDSITLQAIVYDKNGHPIVDEQNIAWHTTGSLAPFGGDTDVPKLRYVANSGPDTGYIVASYDSNGVVLQTSIMVTVSAQPTNALVSAFTGDWDGDGLLDHFTVTFQKPLLLNSVAGIDTDIIVFDNQQGFYLYVDSVYPVNASGNPQTQWVLALQERAAMVGGTRCSRLPIDRL